MTATPPTLTSSLSAGAGVKTYASSDVAVCTINSSTGVVAFVGAGTCSITVSVAQTSDYNLATSAAVSFTLNRATQTVSWSPTTAVLITQSPLTPSASASSSGDGAISYAVASQGATSCSVNSSTGVLTYSAAGSCEVRATAAQTARYSQATNDVTFVVTLAAPAFTLSSGSESKAQNTAITGYTISSTGGAIASYSISPSAPTGTSFNTSTGLLSGTPTSVQSATTYTITATNATSSVSQTFSLTVTLAAPVFTLSSGSETKAQNTAITGYTIGSTGGVIASYSISPSAPTGTSFNTSTGLLSGTPSSVQSATTYTITATNATSSASQTFSLTVTTPASCANGGVCALGNTGPGGGKVFYVAPTTFTCGANLELTCKYLEASPIAYNSETWAFSATSALACYTEGSTTGTSDCRYNSIYSGTSASQSSSRSAAYGMGRGLANTNQIYARLTTAGGSLASSYAAGIAYDYSTTVSGTTFTDWYLPSQDELSQMWINRSSIGELPNADFWTSTEADPNDFRHMFAGTFHTNSGSKSDWTRKVRPIRAFASIP